MTGELISGDLITGRTYPGGLITGIKMRCEMRQQKTTRYPHKIC